MPIRCFLLLTLSWATCLVAQNRYCLPQVADGIVNGGSLRTTIVLANTGTTTANVTVTATRDDASPRPLTFTGLGSGTSLSTKLAPGATRLLVTDGSGDGTAGAAVVISDVPLSVSGLLSNINPAGDTVSESAIPVFEDPELAIEYLVPVDTVAGLNSGVALYNPGTVAATVTLRLLDGSGQPVNSATLTLAPQSHTTYLAKGGLLLAGGFRGTLDVASTAPLAGIAVRQNPAFPAYTLLPAANQISRQLQFYLPRIVDGPTPPLAALRPAEAPGTAGSPPALSRSTVRTTFLLTNLSATPASVSLSLTLDDGSPFVVNIPNMNSNRLGGDTNSAFTATIAPGATVFWQTDGAGASQQSGAAVVQSDQPIGAAAVIGAFDGNHVLTSETGVSAAPSDFQFLMPFDNASKTTSGAAFFNTGPQPVTLTLKLMDQNGGLVASTQLAPLAPGARVTGKVSDFFPGVSPASGAITASTGGPLNAAVSALALRQSSTTSTVLSSAPAMSLPWTAIGTPSTVTPNLDTTRQASTTIPPSGGTLSLTDAKGNRFTLTIPAQALLDPETITMTPISSATGISGPGLFAGVQLEPDGLALLQPALLKIELAAAAPQGTYPIGWHGQSPGLFLNSQLPDPNSLTVVLNHFSGAGAGGYDLTKDLQSIANLGDLFSTAAGYYLARSQQELKDGDTIGALGDRAIAQDIFTRAYNDVIEPLMELASASDDTDVMFCAAQHAQAWEQQRELLGLAGTGESHDAFSQAIADFELYIFNRGLQKLLARCSQHDFTVYFDLVHAFQQAANLGNPFGDDGGAFIQTAQSCLPRLQFTFTSEMTSPDLLTNGFDATLSGNVTLSGSFTATELTQITDPSRDSYTSFQVSGTGPNTYDNFSVTGSLGPGCGPASYPKLTPSTSEVLPGQDPNVSQIQFKFNPYYNPEALTFKGQQLCSFCPVSRKVPVQVELWWFPNFPGETIEWICYGQPIIGDELLWFTAWTQFHERNETDYFFKNWDLQNTTTLFAEKQIMQTITSSGSSYTENTDLKLIPCATADQCPGSAANPADLQFLQRVNPAPNLRTIRRP